MRARRATLAALAACLAAVSVVVAPAGAGPAGRGGGERFAAYVTCAATTRDHDSVCGLDASPRAVFRTLRRARVRYAVCVRRPSGTRRCREKRSGRRGRPSRASIALAAHGGYRVSWHVGGERVARVRIRARAPRVFVNGDSLAVGTRPYLPPALPGWPIRQSTSISRHAPEGVALLRSYGPRLARVVVMQLGTNDDPRADDEFRRAVRATMRIVGPRRCVVWPNIVRPPVAGASYAGYNRALSAVNRRHENLFVVDWAGMVRRNRHWLAPDGVHPNASGYRARARAIAAKARLCLDV